MMPMMLSIRTYVTVDDALMPPFTPAEVAAYATLRHATAACHYYQVL